MGGFIIQGATGGDVNADGNGNFQVVLPRTLAQVGFGAIASLMDEGSITGAVTARAPTTSIDNRLAVGTDSPMFDVAFNATAMNTGAFRYVFASALTCTMGGGSLLMNSASTLTASAGCQLSSWRAFPLLGSGSLTVEYTASFTEDPLANQIVEFGMFPHNTGTVTPLDGCYFRYTSAGLFGYTNFNGTETPTGTSIPSLSVNQAYLFRIVINQRQVDFWVNGVLLGSIEVPSANGAPFMSTALPCSMQFRNGALVSGSPVMQAKIYNVHVDQRDVPLLTPRANQLTGMGMVSSQGQSGGTMGSTALYTNSLAPGVGAAATNTTAALGSGLGGQFSVQPTLAANTDGIIMSYQNPVGGLTQTPRILYITGLWLRGMVTAALTGGPVLYAWSLAYGHTAVSMATTEAASFATATTKAPRRVPLDWDAYAATSALGTLGQKIVATFDSAIPVNPGEFVALVAKNTGTVTSAGVITFLVGFNGYWE